ncbi:MAG: GUN4 domain-containing protein [Oscillatoriaceae cyanobacterium Prado104]|jgi:hypothetical protein|nr:GUN4 domain-containing protein [Oscillatoriaceae cyanobacterium Prado104]
MFPTKTNEVKLVSAVGIDYNRLRNLLASRKWQEADRETTELMLRVAKREEKGWLDRTSILGFPYDDLHTINQLWVNYSNNRFGFSVQQRVCENVKQHIKDDSQVWERFRNLVGWFKKDKKFCYGDIIFSETAPEAHLPSVGLFVGLEMKYESFEQQCGLMTGLGGVVFDAIASRIENSNICDRFN